MLGKLSEYVNRPPYTPGLGADPTVYTYREVLVNRGGGGGTMRELLGQGVGLLYTHIHTGLGKSPVGMEV